MGSGATGVLVAALMCWALSALPAHATFAGQNGRIAYVAASPDHPLEVWSANPDGTNPQVLTGGDGGLRPRWSPDGTKIAFYNGHEVYVMNADGSGRTNITNTPPTDETSAVWEHSPVWSPDGTRIAYSRYETNGTQVSPSEIWIADADGSNAARLDPSTDLDYKPEWHPDGTRISFSGCFEPACSLDPYIINVDGTGEQALPVESNGDWFPDGTKLIFELSNELFSQTVDGTGLTNLSNHPGVDREPKWSPDGTKVVFWSGRGDNGPRIYTMNADGSDQNPITIQAAREPDWQPIPVDSYPRPKGATPFQVYLVPAYEQCTAPNRTHGPPLNFPSCSPPASASSLTVGTADSNGQPANSVSFVRVAALPGNPATPVDEADVQIAVHINDVYHRDPLTDYGGGLGVSAPLQITDKLNTPHPGGPGPGTTSGGALGLPVSCAPTADPGVGATCSVFTTFEAMIPGAVPEGRRSIWALGQVEVTDSDDLPFMRQGVFVP